MERNNRNKTNVVPPAKDKIFSGCWEDLNPEILAQIFIRLPLHEMVGTLSLVCKSWLHVVFGPYCWTDIDVEQWCRNTKRPERIDVVVQKLVRRSRGTFQCLSAYRLGGSAFSFVADCGRCLKVLKIPVSTVTDKLVEKYAKALSNLMILDISYCIKITYKGLEKFGKNCKSLTHLRRNMPPPEWDRQKPTNDQEATVIATTMLGLRHLELGFGQFSDSGLDAILTKCKGLKHLDIRGCWSVKFEGILEEKCNQLLVFRGPWVDDNYRCGGSDSNSDGSGEYPSDSD